jgi:hypothetical protein
LGSEDDENFSPERFSAVVYVFTSFIANLFLFVKTSSGDWMNTLIGHERNGTPTSHITVITCPAGNIITAFPGLL